MMADMKNRVEAEKMVNGVDGTGFHERSKPLDVPDAGTVRETVRGLNSKDECSGTNENEKKTYGRTPGGTGML